ncbi:MAG: Arylsulfatase regulator (Fe-S oxidoreductase) [Proteobacteria bacterium]|nr:Arylsulfatase regulator (Fe-S oxidoreductase) [Pseudomonadota bacterium]
MPLKPSKYNFFYRTGSGGAVLFNSSSGAALAMDRPATGAVVALLQQPERFDLDGSNFLRVRELLASRAFLVPEDLDETDVVRKRHKARQAENRGLALTVAVTKACNFRCVYCYQDHPEDQMNKATAETLLRFAAARLSQGTALYVTWFGGEPLLNMDIIEFLGARLRELCQARNCAYDAFMITNGYRLTPPMLERLLRLGISDFQITLDGDQKDHDRQRPLANGHGTYGIVMRNLVAAAAKASSINVRINLTRRNVDGAAALVERLRELQKAAPAVSISLGRVDQCSAHCGLGPDDLLEGAEFSHWEETLLGPNAAGEPAALPIPFDTVCVAERLNTYVVGPGGDLYKCWNSLGRPEDLIGTLDGSVCEETSAWMRFEASDDDQCGTCKYLPVCQGGCPDTQIRSDRQTKDCTKLRYTLKRRLIDWAGTKAERAKPERRFC